jgi:drug/metabolite transporter (DMT)-like permease
LPPLEIGLPLDANLILFSIVSLSFYNVLLKQASQKLLLLFWVSLFTYIGFINIYLFQTIALQHDLSSVQELIFNYTFEDLPLYITIAFSFLLSMIISEKFLDGYDLSLVIPISQFGILLASAGYIALGDPFQWSLLVGIIIVCLGSFVLSMSTTSKHVSLSMFSAFWKIPGKLWILVCGQALCFTISAVVSYLGIKETARTDVIMTSLRRLHLGPIAFHNAFYFNLGQQLFSVIVFTLYILIRKRYRTEIFSPITTNTRDLALASVTYIAAEYMYFVAFTLTRDTTILLALDNLSIPVTLIFSSLLLKEEIGGNKIIGASLIVIGGLIAVL